MLFVIKYLYIYFKYEILLYDKFIINFKRYLRSESKKKHELLIRIEIDSLLEPEL